MVKKGLVCKWSGFRMWSEIRKPNHLKSGQMVAILLKTIWNLSKNVQIFNGPVYEWLGPYLWKPDHLKSDIQKFPDYWMVGFQIPTLLIQLTLELYFLIRCEYQAWPELMQLITLPQSPFCRPHIGKAWVPRELKKKIGVGFQILKTLKTETSENWTFTSCNVKTSWGK